MKSRIWQFIGVVLVLFVVAGAAIPVAPAMAEEWRVDVHFVGVIRTVPAAPGDPWVIGGQTLAVDSLTGVIATKGPAAPGMFADVSAERRPDGSLVARQIIVKPPEVTLRGQVSSKPETGIGPWVIAGVTVLVTPDTAISSRAGGIDVGSWVEAVMLESPPGTLTAVRIMSIGTQPAVVLQGAIQSFSATAWVLSSIVVNLNESTLRSGGDPVVDLLASATAELQEDGSLLATAIRVQWMDRSAVPPPAKFTGIIESMPVGLPYGTWVIGGHKVYVIPHTQINEEKGLAVVGATVEVVGTPALDGIVAQQITVLSSPLPGGTFTSFVGLIEALPESGILGFWTVAGKQVEVTERTRVEGATPTVGARAAVSGVSRADGTVYATFIRVRNVPPIPTPGPGPIPTRPPRP